jgi:ssDNA-binding Zn-finger/Zn-ribbon topoisomerase 1
MGNSKYCEITQAEFDEFMEPFGFMCMNADRPNQERVYFYTWNDNNYALKVYSSITTKEGVSRRVGADAIRVVVFMKVQGIFKPTGPAISIFRVANWRNNLKKKLNDCFTKGCMNIDYECPLCGAPKIMRKGNRGLFYSCSNWPVTKCPFTESYSK